MWKKPDEKQHKRYLRKRRMRALRAVLCYDNCICFISDYNIFIWFTTLMKVATCLILNRVDGNYYGKVCFAQYDVVFNIDHYDWMSVFVEPSWFRNWKVSLVFDGE